MRRHAITGLSLGMLLAVLPTGSSGGRPQYRAGFAAQPDRFGYEISYGASIYRGGYGFGPAYYAPPYRYYYAPSYDVPLYDTPRRYLEPTPYFTPYGPAPEDYNPQYDPRPVETSDDAY